MKAIISLLLISVLSSLLQPSVAFAQSIDSVIVDTSLNPIPVRVKGMMPDLTLSNISLGSLNDANNTQVINIYFKGCPLNQMLVEYDTTIFILVPFPFDLRIYTLHDTSINCSFPLNTTLIDSLELVSGQLLNVFDNKLLEQNISLYPNPNNQGILYLNTNSLIEINLITIHDNNGKLTRKVCGNVKEITFNQEEIGCYYLHIETNRGILKRKIIRN